MMGMEKTFGSTRSNPFCDRFKACWSETYIIFKCILIELLGNDSKSSVS